MPDCEGKHTESLHEVVAGLKASVSLMAEEEDEEDEEDKENACINVAWAGEREEEESGWWDLDDSWLEMEAEEDNEDGIFQVNALTRIEEEEEEERGGWWTPDPSW